MKTETRLSKSNTEMTAADVVEIVRLLVERNIRVHVDGGWGVDALLGKQTRSHEDLDIAVEHRHVSELRKLLGLRGYEEVLGEDSRDCNFVLADECGHRVDVHSYTFDSAGNHVFGIEYPLDSLTGIGNILDLQVECISPAWMVKFHSGYELDRNDFRDISALCERFGIELPQEYRKFLELNAHENVGLVPRLDFIIREYTPEDAEAVSNVICRCLREVNSAEYPEETISLMTKTFSSANLPKWFQKMDKVVVLAEGRNILATGSLQGNQVMTVFVNPDMHGSGLGSKMMDHLEKLALSGGHQKVILKSSLSSFDFYCGRGYVEVDRIHQDVGGAMVCMEKSLYTKR